MNEIMNKFLLVGDKFMPEMHLKQLGFTGPFTRIKERIEKCMQTGNTDFIYRNELDKACVQHDMAYGKSKDLAKRTQSDKRLRDKAFKITSDPKYDGYQRGLASAVYKFFDKKSSGSGIDALLTNKSLLNQIINSRMNFISILLENSREEKFIHLLELLENSREEKLIHLLETIFGALI